MQWPAPYLAAPSLPVFARPTDEGRVLAAISIIDIMIFCENLKVKYYIFEISQSVVPLAQISSHPHQDIGFGEEVSPVSVFPPSCYYCQSYYHWVSIYSMPGIMLRTLLYNLLSFPRLYGRCFSRVHLMHGNCEAPRGGPSAPLVTWLVSGKAGLHPPHTLMSPYAVHTPLLCDPLFLVLAFWVMVPYAVFPLCILEAQVQLLSFFLVP